MSHESLLMTADEVAAKTEVKRSTIYALARRGGIPGVVYVGRLLRFRRKAITLWLESDDRAKTERRRR